MQPNSDFTVDIVEPDLLGTIKVLPFPVAKNIYISYQKRGPRAFIPTKDFLFRIRIPEVYFPKLSREEYSFFSAKWTQILTLTYTPYCEPFQYSDASAPVGPKIYFLDAEIVGKLPFSKAPLNPELFMYSDKYRQIMAHPIPNTPLMRCVEFPSILSVPTFLTVTPDQTPFTTGEWVRPLKGVREALQQLDRESTKAVRHTPQNIRSLQERKRE